MLPELSITHQDQALFQSLRDDAETPKMRPKINPASGTD
jgi:hypothetical protein